MYGSCYRCYSYQKGPIGSWCSQCNLKPLMLRGEAVGIVRPRYWLIQVKDIFLDSCLIAQIFGKGHDVTKADMQHGWEGVMRKVDGAPFNEIYQRLDAKRKVR